MNIQIAEGILIPFLGTSLGAAMVFFLKKQISGGLQKALTGFAAGVMVAASFWSLLEPALESSAGMGTLAFLPAAAAVTILAAGLVTPVMPYFLAFAAGAMMYVVVEELIPEMSEGRHSNIGTVAFALGFVVMMILDVTLG